MPKIYLAGPDVFLPNAVALGWRKKALCQAYGFAGLFPFDNEVGECAGGRIDHVIFAANIAMIEEADCGIFNLTPFRGPSADAGTVFELGMMAGQKKPVFGYTNDPSDMRARIRDATQSPDGTWRDSDGSTVEDFGNADNLMIDACLASGGNALFRLDEAARLDDLRGFEQCLQHAATIMAERASPKDRLVRAFG